MHHLHATKTPTFRKTHCNRPPRLHDEVKAPCPNRSGCVCSMFCSICFLFLILQNWLAHTFSPYNVQLKVFPNRPDPTIRSCVLSSGYVGLPSFFGDCHLDHQLANFWLALKLGFVSTNALASKLGFCCWVKFERRLFGGQAFFLGFGLCKLKPFVFFVCVCTSLISNSVFDTNWNF